MMFRQSAQRRQASSFTLVPLARREGRYAFRRPAWRLSALSLAVALVFVPPAMADVVIRAEEGIWLEGDLVDKHYPKIELAGELLILGRARVTSDELHFIDGGTLILGTGASIDVGRMKNTVNLNKNLAGRVIIGALEGGEPRAAGVLNAGVLTFLGTSDQPFSLVLNHTDTDYVFQPRMISVNAGVVRQLAGTTILTGDNRLYLGTFEIKGGTLSVSSAQQLGAETASLLLDGGTLRVTGEGFTAHNQNIAVGNNGARIEVTDSAGKLTLGQTVANADADLYKTGEGTLELTGQNAYRDVYVAQGALGVVQAGALTSQKGMVGTQASRQGSVLINGMGANWKFSDDLALGVGADTNGILEIKDGGKVSGPRVRIGRNTDSVGTVTVSGMDDSGNASLLETTLQLFVGGSGTGTLRILDGGRLVTSGGITRIAAYTFANGLVEVSGARNNQAATWDSVADIQLGAGNSSSISEHSVLAIRNGGVVNVGTLQADGSHDGTVHLLGNGTYSDFIGSELVIGADFGSAPVAAGTLNAAKVSFVGDASHAGAERVVFNHSGQTTFGASLQGGVVGYHSVRHLAGTTTLTGDSAGFSGVTVVNGGTLLVGDAQGKGVLGGRVDVEHGGTLGGSGRLAGSTIVKDGGTLSAGNSAGTLTIDGDLTLGGKTVFELGTPGVAGGSTNDFVAVGGNLQLGGELDARLAAAGRYQLFDYGTLSAGSQFSQVSLSSTRSGFRPVSSQVDTGIAGKVFLSVLGSGQTLQHWNGAQTSPSGTVTGGSGTWSNWGSNWTNDDGSASAGWAASVGVFGGQAGTVTVDDTVHGPVSFDTLQFSTDGYALLGGALAIGAAAGGVFNIDNGVTTLVRSVIADGVGSRLVKTGGGTLSLSDQNTYAGGTQVLGGVLSVADDAALGATGGSLMLDGGSLRVTGDVYGATARAVTLGAAGGSIDISESGHRLALSQGITGDGSLRKLGDGMLRLDGTGSYTGGTQVAAGTLEGTAASIRGNIANAGTVVFLQETNAAFAGDVGGLSGTAGAMVKQGVGALALDGASTLDWAVQAGSLRAEAGRFSGDVRIDDGAAFMLQHADGAVYDGMLSGSGSLALAGAGAMILTADSFAFTGTTTLSGTALQVDGTLGGNVTVRQGQSLSGAGSIGGNVDLTLGGGLKGESGKTLRVDGRAVLDAASTVEARLGGTSGSALFDIGDSLTLDGILNVSDAGGFGAGVYRLFTYGGALTDNGLDIGAMPNGAVSANLAVQTSVAGQVNLLSSVGAELRFWDGGNANLHDNGAVDGGAGVWQGDNRNWTQPDGVFNGPLQPSPVFAVFQKTGGVVQVDAAAGAAAVTGMQFTADGYRLQGDAIALQGVDGRTVIRVGDGASADVRTQIDAVLTGDTTLVKEDNGTLTLAGANTYTGGTQVAAGTLEGNAVSIRGNIANAGTVVFQQETDAAFAGDIGGLSGTAGAMVKRGGGALALDGASTLDWAVQAGSLRAEAGRFSGDVRIDDGAAFTLQHADGAVYGGVVSGVGDLALSGAGLITLAGNSAAFAGSTSLSAGSALRVGAAAGSALGGSLTIGAGAELGGTGTLGAIGSVVTVASGAVHAPGNSIGTQAIAGDYVNHGTLRIEATPDDADKVVVAGAVDISGATLDLSLSPGDAAAWNVFNGPFTILEKQSQGSVTGQFDRIAQNLLFLDQSVDYAGGDGNDVTLSLTRNDLAFAALGQTANQTATGGAIDALGNTSAVWRAIALDGDADSVRASYDALSGEIHASARTALMEDSRLVRQAANDRLRAAFGAAGAPAASAMRMDADGTAQAVSPLDRGPAVWSQVLGTWGSTGSDGNAARLSRSAKGVLVGADRMLGEWRVGVLAGYSRSDMTVGARAASGNSDNYHAGLYGATQAGRVALRAGAAYTWHRLDVSRAVQAPGITQRLKSQYHGGTVQAFAEAGVGMHAGAVRLEPFAGLAHVSLRTNGADEQGGQAALRIDQKTTSATFTTLGLRAEHGVSLGAVDARLTGALGWRHAFGDAAPQSRHAFGDVGAFGVRGVPIARNSLLIEAGLSASIGKQTELGVFYSGQQASDARDHAVKLNLTARF